MRIYIPSRGRAQSVNHGPLKDLSPAQRRQVMIIVPTSEVQAYQEALEQWQYPEPGVLGMDYTSIGEKRRKIAQIAKYMGDDKFLMSDDDVVFSVRRSDEDWRLRRCEPTDVGLMLQTMEILLNEVASVGISGREGNNRPGVGHALADNMVPRATRVMRVLAYRTEDFLACEHDRVRVMEDFDIQLQLLRKGLGNACLYYWANGQEKTNATGGCSLWRTHEIHEASAYRLTELHPGFVRLRQKSNKTDREGFGTRTEVTIAWKKAHEEGKLARN